MKMHDGEHHFVLWRGVVRLPVKRLKRVKIKGKMVNARDENGKIIYQEKTTRTVDTVWRIRCLQPANKKEWVHYDTQKPVDLIERILQLSTDSGDLLLDDFVGSGATAVACEKQALYEYLVFILKLYHAQPVAGPIHLHGKKGRAMVHIGAVDAPVTIAEIDAAVDECVQVKQPELHVVGWKWEMGLYDLMVDTAKKKGVKLLLLQIPREVIAQQVAAKGDVRFFELAYLESEIKTPKKLTVQVSLKDFVIPNTDLLPKKERKLTLTSEPHRYKKAGTYRILVKVIDIFGNDTSQAFDVEVS